LGTLGKFATALMTDTTMATRKGNSVGGLGVADGTRREGRLLRLLLFRIFGHFETFGRRKCGGGLHGGHSHGHGSRGRGFLFQIRTLVIVTIATLSKPL